MYISKLAIENSIIETVQLFEAEWRRFKGLQSTILDHHKEATYQQRLEQIQKIFADIMVRVRNGDTNRITASDELELCKAKGVDGIPTCERDFSVKCTNIQLDLNLRKVEYETKVEMFMNNLAKELEKAVKSGEVSADRGAPLVAQVNEFGDHTTFQTRRREALI